MTDKILRKSRIQQRPEGFVFGKNQIKCDACGKFYPKRGMYKITGEIIKEMDTPCCPFC